MNRLNKEQKQLLIDYCIGLTSEQENAEAQALINSNEEAAKIHAKFKVALSPLDSLELEDCPDELVERTILQANNLRDLGQHQLEQLLATEQTKKVTTKISFWRNFSEVAAVAAAIMLIVGVLVPAMSASRQKSWRQRCQRQMGSIFRGISDYISDNDGRLPAVATAVGAPWWKVGYQGEENQSNTRHVYLLAKNDYVDMNNFVCPGSKGEKPVKLTDSQIKKLKDFPGREHITYSFQIRCRTKAGGKLMCRKALMADWNPLFEQLPEDFSRQLRLRLNRKLLTLNSVNHDRRGQNVLFGDGCVRFLKTRFIGISEDDIYTLQDTDIYRGSEVPSCETDFFLAP
jgi:hypothetical protein